MAFRADRLRQMREAKGWRPADLARAASTTEGQISRYEAGQRVPAVDVLAKLAVALEMSADFFLGIDTRYDHADDPRTVAAHLTLDWYLRGSGLGYGEEYVRLRRVAAVSRTAPVSVEMWTMVQEAVAIASPMAATTGRATPATSRRGSRARRGRTHTPS